MCVPEILHMRATAQEFDATKYGPCCELFFFLMRRETHPTGPVLPRHVSTESRFYFTQTDAQRSAGNGPLEPRGARWQPAMASFEWPQWLRRSRLCVVSTRRACKRRDFFITESPVGLTLCPEGVSSSSSSPYRLRLLTTCVVSSPCTGVQEAGF